MAKSKKVQMPIGIRNKLMAAVSMLLVSSIMMVSSTFAWFTLSTAPEVTGITTSVGANGNLEMALLNTETFANLDSIASAVGNSSQATGSVTAANITWGNLVDLADASYGLQTISLMPSRLNIKITTEGEQKTYFKTVDNPAELLKTPTYGKDGRVADLSGKTYASGSYSNGTWTYDAHSLTYGVRAIGANDNLTPQEAGLIAAKAAYNTNLASAKSTIQTALSTHGQNLASAITTLAMNNNADLDDEQKTSITALVTASGTALNYIDAAYKQVLLAVAAQLPTEPYNAIAEVINDATSYNDAVSKITAKVTELNNGLPEENQVAFTAPTYLSTAAAALDTQKTAVSAANGLLGSDVKGALKKLVDTDKVIVNGFNVSDDDEETSNDLMVGGNPNSAFAGKVINDGGAIVEMPDDSGVFAYIGKVAGNYSASCKVNIVYGTIDLKNLNATMKTTATVDTAIGNQLKDIQANTTGDGTTALSDTYGYALDFAFRTNATSSYLQLQTTGTQRVYSDSDSAATQGGGSTMTFKAATTDAGTSVLTDDQVKNLMGAIRVAFIDPTSGKIYGIASLDNINPSGDAFKGDLTLKDYSFRMTDDAMTLQSLSNKDDTEMDETVALMELPQNVPVRLTAVVWLDGDQVDNGDVANAAQSLVGSMNLQFSSSAKLQPMQNTALHNMTITYTAETGDLADNGFYQYQGTLYKLNTGYKVYKGSDSMVYFSNDETNYTKLTEMSLADAMTRVSVKITGEPTVQAGGDVTLTAALDGTYSGADLKSVSWVSGNNEIATVAADGNTAATVGGVAAGQTSIDVNTIKVTIGSTEVDLNMSIVYIMTVTAAA